MLVKSLQVYTYHFGQQSSFYVHYIFGFGVHGTTMTAWLEPGPPAMKQSSDSNSLAVPIVLD